MIHPQLQIQLERPNGLYQAGDVLQTTVRIRNPDAMAIRALECSVLWYTVGQGEEDLAVHYFHDEEPSPTQRFSPDHPLQFECRLPASPLSYDGIIVKLCWCVRARLFLNQGREIVEEIPFRLGQVRAAVIVSET